MSKYLNVLLFFMISFNGFSQARLILNNGGIVNITNNAFVVIDNPNTNAITRNTAGHIISEGEFNRVKWNIGTTAGTYILPFGIGAAEYLPVSLTTSGASGASGSLTFAMYPVGSWLNSANLPTGVTNFVNNYSTDNSAFAIDRFWRIQPSGYTVKPALDNLVFTYRDIEWSVASNNIMESNLIAQRYNDSLNSWDDYMPGTVTNTINNTSTVAALPSAELFTWWTLVDNRFILPIELISFSALCRDSYVFIDWQTASEYNNHFFVVERSADGEHFDVVGQVNAMGNTNTTQYYSLQDNQPLKAKSYYRLKQVDEEGNYSYSSIVVTDCKQANAAQSQLLIYPNPASDMLTIDIKNIKGKKTFVIYSVLGQEMLQKQITGEQEDVREIVDVAALANATYLLRIDVNEELYQVIKFVKK